jgi:hypothetical protein
VHETRQRNAELALINSVQDALAGELELQAIYDVVGDKLRESSTRRSSTIGMYDEASGLSASVRDRARRASGPRAAAGRLPKHVMETREPLMIAEDVAATVRAVRQPSAQRRAAKSLLFVPARRSAARRRA